MAKPAKPVDPSDYDGNFIREVDPVYRGNRKDRMVELRCTVCNNPFVVTYTNSKRIRQKTCSNQCGGVITRQVQEYRADTHPLYTVWLSLRDRCRNPNNGKFHRYGDRGITFSPTFDTFHGFLTYVGSLDNYPYSSSGKVLTEYSLDRINCNLGYVEGNLRWADVCTQAANKSWKKPNSTSKYIGVIYCSTNKAWIAKLQHKGEVHHLYYGDSEEEAYFARKKFIQDNNLPHAY